MDSTRLGSTWPRGGIALDLDVLYSTKLGSTWPRDGIALGLRWIAQG